MEPGDEMMKENRELWLGDGDVDALIEIHEAMSGCSDDAIAGRCRAYLQSGKRKYRIATKRQKKPGLRVIDGGKK